MQKEFRLPEEVRQSLLEYLSTRPYREVAQGIAALMSLEEVTTESTQSEMRPSPDESGQQGGRSSLRPA